MISSWWKELSKWKFFAILFIAASVVWLLLGFGYITYCLAEQIDWFWGWVLVFGAPCSLALYIAYRCMKKTRVPIKEVMTSKVVPAKVSNAQRMLKFQIPVPMKMSLPGLCCYCGAPATEYLDFNAGVEYEQYFFRHKVTTKVGANVRMGYCVLHHTKALIIKKKLSTLHTLVLLDNIVTLCGSIFIGLLLLRDILTGVFLGILLAGMLFFVLPPLFNFVNGKLLLSRLDPEIRNDLSAHLDAQGTDLSKIGGTPYTLGFSINYKFQEKGSVQLASVCLSSKRYAARFKEMNHLVSARMD